MVIQKTIYTSFTEQFIEIRNVVPTTDSKENSSIKQNIYSSIIMDERKEGKDEQNVLFGQLLNHINILQQNISSSQSIILYGPHIESGLGNTVIGLVSSLVSALATNRGFQMIPFIHYNFFYDPIPNFYYQKDLIPKQDMEDYFFYATLAQGRLLRNNHLNKLTKKKSLQINCFTDVTPHFLENSHYQDTWQKLHLWKDQTPHIENVVSLFYELAMYPKQPLCNIIVNHAEKLLTRKMIGVQVRIGGKRKLYTDKQFLTTSDLSQFFTKIDSFMTSNHLDLKDVYVFVSTDDPSIHGLFKERYKDSVYIVDDFVIGHSSVKKNFMNSVKVASFTKRAILDILLLQRADYLIYTNTSSYGFLASKLQSNRNSPIRIDDYIDWSSHEDKCSVFERSSRPFYSDVVGRMIVQ